MQFLHYTKIFLAGITVAMASLPAYAANILGIKGEEHSSIGIYIKDIQADTIVFQSDADRGHVPASIMKSFTAASAMSLLDPNFRFETKVYLTGKSGGNGQWNGNILVKASGDPTLESEYFPKQAGFANDIVSALAAKGITHINGDIVLARVVEGRDYAQGPLPTWEIDDACWAYGAGVFDFNWADNFFGLYPATGKTTSPVPGLKYEVWSKPWSGGSDLIRGVYSDSLIVIGSDYAKSTKARINTSMPYPFATFRAVLKSKLAAKGIELTSVKDENTTRTHLLTHKSAPLDEILRSLMLRSDNMFAEGILKILGQKYGDVSASVKAETELWASRGLSPEYNTIKDGSGLSRADCINPRFLGDVLEWMARSDMSRRFVKLFPVAGINGTMKNFMATTSLKGRLAMKTGSMSGVQCYAGYLTDTEGTPTHVVVVMANDFFCSRADLKSAISNFLLEKLAD